MKDTLLTLEFEGRAPREVVLVAAVPARVEMGLLLSPALERAVPAAVDAVLEELRARGVEPARRAPGDRPGPWWRR